jgi:hypothetical protein
MAKQTSFIACQYLLIWILSSYLLQVEGSAPAALAPPQSQLLAAAGVRRPPAVPAGTADFASLGIAKDYSRDVKRRKLPTATTDDECAAFVYEVENAVSQSGAHSNHECSCYQKYDSGLECFDHHTASKNTWHAEQCLLIFPPFSGGLQAAIAAAISPVIGPAVIAAVDAAVGQGGLRAVIDSAITAAIGPAIDVAMGPGGLQTTIDAAVNTAIGPAVSAAMNTAILGPGGLQASMIAAVNLAITPLSARISNARARAIQLTHALMPVVNSAGAPLPLWVPKTVGDLQTMTATQAAALEAYYGLLVGARGTPVAGLQRRRQISAAIGGPHF